MEKLPVELKNKIVSYLPIHDSKQRSLIKQIKVSKKINDIIKIYKHYWRHFDVTFDGSHSIDSLINDIQRWMNDDIGTMYQINFKYVKYSALVFNVDKSLVDSQDKLNIFESRLTSLSLAKLYLYEFDKVDLDECISFLNKCIL